MPAVRGLTVAVGGWYASTLDIVLIRNMRHLTECVVVTAPGDEAVKAVAAKVPGVRVFETDAFTRHGARFNKGLALEESFDVLGRDGLILIFDADILFPDHLHLERVRPGHLHGARRRVLEDAAAWHPGLDASKCPVLRDGGPIGFFQLFHGRDPAVRDRRPWYNVNYPHAGGGDAAFVSHWPRSRHLILPVDTLHLGPTDTNWFGSDPEGRAMAAAYFHRMGWRRALDKHDPSLAATASEPPERIHVPGYETSDYVMPFERRAKEAGRA